MATREILKMVLCRSEREQEGEISVLLGGRNRERQIMVACSMLINPPFSSMVLLVEENVGDRFMVGCRQEIGEERIQK